MLQANHSLHGLSHFYSWLILCTLPHLRQDIASINNNIAPGLIRRRITSEVKIQAFDLLHVALPSKRCHPIRFVDDIFRGPHLGVEKAGRDDVHARKLAPLAR